MISRALARAPARAERRAVIVYLHEILKPWMTFVKAQADNLERYDAVYAGGRRCAGLEIGDRRCITINRRGKPVENVREKLFRSTGFDPAFYRAIESSNPCLVHAHFGTSALAGLRIARKVGRPLIVTFHGRDATMTEDAARQSYRGREMLRARAALGREAAAIIAVSNFIRDRLLAQGYPPSKVVVHYNGVDTAHFAPDPAVRREKVVLFVGRLVEKKGCRYLLEALREIKAAHPDARAVIVGDGPEAAALRRFALDHRLAVEFLGLKPPRVVKAWMNRASLLALPSVTARDGDSEGLPTVLVEAQAMGLPVVGTRHAGIPEALIDGRTGYLVEERDERALADRIRALLSDDALRAELGANARDFMREKFDLRRQIEGLEALYDRASGGGRGPQVGE